MTNHENDIVTYGVEAGYGFTDISEMIRVFDPTLNKPVYMHRDVLNDLNKKHDKAMADMYWGGSSLAMWLYQRSFKWKFLPFKGRFFIWLSNKICKYVR